MKSRGHYPHFEDKETGLEIHAFLINNLLRKSPTPSLLDTLQS